MLNWELGSIINNLTLVKYTYLIILCIFFVCCTDEKSYTSLNESEIFFEETLASISKDEKNDSIYYIGTEDGIVYIYNSETQQLEKITTDFDRIYKVVRDTITKKEPVYWVGTRNMGLFCCELKNNSFVYEGSHSHFYIPDTIKSTQYSVYDISIQDSVIYVATSHGLFKVPNREDSGDTLMILRQDLNKEESGNLQPAVAGKMRLCGNQYLVCASDSGLLRIDISTDCVKKLLARKVNDVVIHGNSIYSLIGDSVVVTDIHGTRYTNQRDKDTASFALKQPAQLYYYDDTQKINYFLSNHSIQLVKDQDLRNVEKYKVVSSRRPLRTKCHNLMVNDLLHRQSLLVTIHSISRIGHHQDVFNDEGNVKLACSDKDNIYYLIDTRLYRQKKNEKEASPLKDINKGTKDIRFMEVLNDTLYYVDSSHEIYKAKLYSNYFLNSILSWDSHIKQNPDKKKDVTAIGKDRMNVYVGVRDGFRNINAIDKDIRLKDLSINTTISRDPFITRFTTHGDKTLFCTLNDGIFIGKDNLFARVSGSNSYAFIRDIGIDSSTENKIRILTNHGFYQQDDSVFNKISDVSGYNRLLVLDSDHVYGVSNYGIINLCDGMKYFVDIQFNPMACFVVDNKIYAGSGNGVYVFSSDLSKEDGIVETSESYYTIDFDEQEFFSRKNILIFVLILLASIVGLWWYDRYRMGRHAVQTYKDGLVMRLDELNTVREYLDPEMLREIDGLTSEVEGVDVLGKKKALAKLRDISLRIMGITGRVPSKLVQILQEQISQIKKCGLNDAPDYIGKSNEAIKKNTLLRLGGQIKANSKWLSETQLYMIKLSNYRSLFACLPTIPGVTDEIKKVFRLSKSPSEQVYLIEEMVRRINDDSSKEKIRSYLGKKIDECSKVQSDYEEGTEFYSISGLINEKYCSIINDMSYADDASEIMKLIPGVDRHLSIIHILTTIRSLLPEYNKASYEYEHKHKEIENRKKEGFYVLKEACIRDKDEEEEKKRQERCTAISAEIIRNISELYKEFAHGSEMDILKTLEISIKESEGRQFMQANLLALLLTGTDIPVSRYKNLFGVNEQSLRRVRRELMKQLAAHRQDLIKYAEENNTSIAILLLKLIDSSETDTGGTQ